MDIKPDTVYGKEKCCLNPAQCSAEEDAIRAVRTDLEKLSDAMAKTSETISAFRNATLEAAKVLVNGIEEVGPDLESLPDGMKKSWFSFYASGLSDVEAEYAKVLNQ